MKLWDNVKNIASRDRVQSKTKPLWGNAVFSKSDYFGHAHAYRTNELIYACINELSATTAEAPLISDNEAVNALIAKPNPLMSAISFIEAWVSYAYIDGNVFVRKERDATGNVIGLWLLRPDRVDIDKDGYVHTIGEERQVIEWADIIHFALFNPLDDWRGLSPMSVLLKNHDNDNAITTFLNQFFNNAGVPYGLLKTSRPANKTERERIQQQWQEQFSGARALSKIAVLDSEANYTQIGLDVDAMDFSNISARTESRICATFGIPPILVGALVGLQTSTFANYGNARRSLWDETIIPLCRRIEGDLAHGLEEDFPNVRVWFDLSNVPTLREDRSIIVDRAIRAHQAGLMTLEEARDEIGLGGGNATAG